MFSTSLYEFVEDEQLCKSMGDKEEMDINEHMNFISHVCVAQAILDLQDSSNLLKMTLTFKYIYCTLTQKSNI